MPPECYQLFNLEQPGTGCMFSARHNARHHYVTAQAFPETFYRVFDFLRQLGEESLGVRGVNGDMHVIALEIREISIPST
jgi:hypothetical protein